KINHPPVLAPALAVKRGGQPVSHGAFNLRGDLVRIDDVPAIERQHHAMDLELAAVADRDLGDRGRVAAGSHELRNAAMNTGRQRLAPVALLSRAPEHGAALAAL